MTKDQIIEQVAISLFVQNNVEFVGGKVGTTEELAVSCWRHAEIFANAKQKAIPVKTTTTPVPKP